MARSLVNELFDRLIEAFPADQARAPEDFSADPMPSPVAHFLTHLLRHQAAREMPALDAAPASAWIDADHPDVQAARAAYRDALERHAQFPPSEWDAALRRALQRVTAYLIHPTQTLTHFVYGNQEGGLAPETIRQRIQFFDAYTYLHEAVNRYLRKHEPAAVDRARFEDLLQRVDREVTSDYDVDQWMRLLRPLFDLVHVAAPDREVPTPFLQTFFAEKNASAIARRLQTASVQHGTTSFSPDDLRQLITADKAPSAPARPAASSASSADAASPPNESADTDASESAPEPPEPAPTSDAHQPTPLWKRFRQDRTSTAAAASSPAPTEEPDEEEEQPLWTKFRPDTDADQQDVPAEITALENDVLGPRGSANRDLFIRKLFDGDREAYKETLERLREAPNWSRASQIIAQDIFRAHQVNIYSDSAVTFTDAVEDRFKKMNG